MANFSDFREALTNKENVDLIVDRLGMFDWTGLLAKVNGLDKNEGDEIKLNHSDSREQLRAIISKIVEKDSSSAYIGFSKVLERKNAAIWGKVFPFKPEHSKLVVQPKRDPPLVQSSNAPHILWLCSKDIFQGAKVITGVSDRQMKSSPKGNFNYFELPPMFDGANDTPVWLFGPVDNSSESQLPGLLQYYGKSNYFIFTGTGTAISRHRIQDNDICVIKPREPVFRPLVEELCHMTVLWDLNKDIKKWQCSKVVYGTVGVSGSGNDVVSTAAYAFSRNLPKTICAPNVAILSVKQDHSSKCYECGEPHYYHSIHYSYQVIKYLCEKKLLLDCFDN